MDATEYEAVTAALYEVLGKSTGATVIGYGPECKVPGKSGGEHQIDVLIEQSNGLQSIRTAIECKYWNKRVPRDRVLAFVGVLEDTNIEKGVIVSKEGFQSGAMEVAKARNIDLVEMREPKDADWEGRIKGIVFNMHIRVSEGYDFEFIQPEMQAGPRSTFEASGQELVVKEPGREPRTLDDIVKGEIDPYGEDGQAVEVRFTKGTIMEVAEHGHAELEALRFKMRYTNTESVMTLDGTELVRLIVKRVFSDQWFNIMHDGQVIEKLTQHEL